MYNKCVKIDLKLSTVFQKNVRKLQAAGGGGVDGLTHTVECVQSFSIIDLCQLHSSMS